ncbi:MAG: alkaline phosphatase D family protein [Vicinamibacteria bacterium]
MFPFVSTEGSEPEFGTAIALVDGLRPEHRYRYSVLFRGRVVPGGHGSFRTMPRPGSMADVLFVTVSCSDWTRDGAWLELEQFVRDQRPRFILMVGDQVYLDFGTRAEKIWPTHLKTSPKRRRQLMAERYRDHWRRAPIRWVMANTPTYMLWSDHEIRDGWGSWASDSPTLQARYPKGAHIAAEYNAYFEDARKLYWHFQMCHNFAAPIAEPYVPGARTAIPVQFQCGRLAVLMLDDRGDRDLWRESNRALGDQQWSFLENEFLPNLAPDIDALAIVTQGPIVSMSPNGLAVRQLGNREDDVELFKRGNARALLELQAKSDSNIEYAYALVDQVVFKDFLPDADLNIADFDDVRDNWSHPRCQPEQERLIRRAGDARMANRDIGQPRAVMFVGGDIHTGALYEIAVTSPAFTAPCLISSGIAQARGAFVGVKLDDDHVVAEGIRASLRHVVGDFNFGVTHILFNGGTPVITNTIGHPNTSDVYTFKYV